MANRSLFRSLAGALIPKADTRNEAGGSAYAMTAEQTLAQYAATGCLNATFYAGAKEQLDRVLALTTEVTPEFIAKTAVYARERGAMKDMPALLLAVLSRRDPALMDRVFDRVVDTPRMLRTFVQIVRSGRGRAQVARLGAEAMCAALAGPADRRGAVCRVGRTARRRWPTS